MNRTFNAGLLAGVGLVVALLVVNAAVSYRNTRQLDDDARLVAHTHQVLDALEGLLGTFRDAETGQRGYLLTGEDGYLAPYNDALTTFEKKIERVRLLTADNPAQQDRVPELRELAAAKMKELSRTVALARQGGPDAALTVVKAGEGRRLMDALRAKVKEMEEEEQGLLARRQAATDRAYATAVWAGFLAAALGLLVVGGFVWLLERHQRSQTRAAAAIHRERETLQATLVSIGDGVIVADREGRVTFLNPVAQHLAGWTPEDARGRLLPEVFHIVSEDTRQEVENPALRALKEGRVVGLANHTVLIARDGTERPIDDSSAPIREASGRIGGAVLVFRDVTERRRAEGDLRESERRLRFVMDSMPQKIYTARASGEVDYFNPQWTEFTGLAIEQIREWGWTQFIHPDDEEGNVRAWKQSLADGEPFLCEHRFRRADGEYRWHVSRAVPMRGEAGRVVLWVGSSTDIHDVKQSEEALREADRKKDEFLATLAHELRNPLAPIRNGLQVLRLARGDPDATGEAHGMMERQLAQLVHLVDDLLDVSRITRGKLQLRREWVDLADVVRSAVETARQLIEASGHELKIALPSEPAWLNADPTRLAQVFANLLTNAAKYTERGGHIRLTVGRDGGEVIVTVKDNGIGIAPGHLPRLFEKFSQVGSALERSQGGLGIGLSLVKGLVEMHGGMVEALSEGLGRGSEFVVRLPVQGPPPAGPTQHAVGDERPRAQPGRRILVADDQRDAADSLAMLLRLAGHEVLTVHDGQAAVEAAGSFRPDAVLLDIGMPKLNGYDACRRIREQPWGRGMLLVALTGWGQEEDKRRASEAGFDHHLTKPVDPTDLAKLLAESRAGTA